MKYVVFVSETTVFLSVYIRKVCRQHNDMMRCLSEFVSGSKTTHEYSCSCVSVHFALIYFAMKCDYTCIYSVLRVSVCFQGRHSVA